MAQWQFNYDQNYDTSVPEIIPYTPGKSFNRPNNKYNSNSQNYIVDVVGNYYWTQSKPLAAGGRSEVPSIILKERKLLLNSMIAQAAYSIGTIAQSSTEILKTIVPSSTFNYTKNKISTLLNVSPVSGTAGTSDLSSAFMSKISNVLGDDPSFLQDAWLEPYKGLYLTQKTGWVYYLPFFQNKYQTTTNSWGSDSSSSGGSLFQGVTELTQEVSNLLGKFETLFKAGSFQEKTKFFQFSQDGDSIDISFPLINTGSATYEDVVNNWQFIFQLIYQNRAERVDRNIVNPPMMYEVSIPGVRYIPYAYISNIGIEYLGSRRTMDIIIPVQHPTDSSDQTSSNSTTVDTFKFRTIVPEAYQVNLTITGLVADSKNFLYSTVKGTNIIVE